MYAVIKTGGKQYKVSPGDVIEVEHLKVKGGDPELKLTPLLVVTDESETVSGAERLGQFPVSAKILGETKGDKITVFKYRPKSGYASKTGHRQLYSLIQITSIGDAKASELKTAEDVQPQSTGPQKPAPVEKSEPEPDADQTASAAAGDASFATGPDTPAAGQHASGASAETESSSGASAQTGAPAPASEISGSESPTGASPGRSAEDSETDGGAGAGETPKT